MEQNFLMNLIVLSLTQIFCNPNGKKNYIRMILASFIGAWVSVCALVIGSFYVYVAVTAIILVPFMLVIAFGRIDRLSMDRNTGNPLVSGNSYALHRTYSGTESGQ